MIASIALSQLIADPRNPNVCSKETLEKLQRNIERTGLCPALIVRPHPTQKDHYVLIDGHHRKLVLERLGWTEAPCQIWNLSEQEAALALATLNRLRGEDIPHKRAELIEELLQHFENTELDLSSFLPESESQLQDLLSLLTLDQAEQERQFQEALACEKASLPVMFHFLIPADQASWVQDTLARFQPTGTQDPSGGFLALCQYAMKDAEQPHDS
jgi:ParB/RepB/Spo0J family partition protein